jgi:hypothetical protein
MKARFTQSFKIQAVEKALERANDVSLKDIAVVFNNLCHSFNINAQALRSDTLCPIR